MINRTLTMAGVSFLALSLALATNPTAIAQEAQPEKSTSDQVAEIASEAGQTAEKVASDVADQAGKVAGAAATEGQALVESAALSAGEAIKESLTVSDSVDGPNVSANDLIEATVYGPDGKKLAMVNDLIISPDGQVQSVVLSFGGFFGIGDKLIAVTPDRVTIETAEDRSMAARTELTKADMETADTFAYVSE